VKLQDRERETEFNKALNAAIQEMPVISKEGDYHNSGQGREASAHPRPVRPLRRHLPGGAAHP
jgi:hypothetical protein